MLIIASTDLQKEIVEGGRVSHSALILNPMLAARFCFTSSAFVAEIKTGGRSASLRERGKKNNNNRD